MDVGLTVETVLLMCWLDVEYEEKLTPACLSQAHGGGRTICWDGEASERRDTVFMVPCGHAIFGVY